MSSANLTFDDMKIDRPLSEAREPRPERSTHLDKNALDAGISAYLASVKTYAPLRPDLTLATSTQLAAGVAASIRAYLAALPADHLVKHLRRHADAEADGELRYTVTADQLIRSAADRISELEAELAEVAVHTRTCG
jgi:hypothetical protein